MFIFKILLMVNILIIIGCDRNILHDRKKSIIREILVDNNQGPTGKIITEVGVNLPLEVITSNNASAYRVEGKCNYLIGSVEVVFGLPETTLITPCKIDNTFSGIIDLRGVTSNPAEVSISQGDLKVVLKNNDRPINDQKGPASAPVAEAPNRPVGGQGYNLKISCNEAGEVVSITGNGLSPKPQTYTCYHSGTEYFDLTLEQEVSFVSPNNLTISSKDKYGNSAGQQLKSMFQLIHWHQVFL